MLQLRVVPGEQGEIGLYYIIHSCLAHRLRVCHLQHVASKVTLATQHREASMVEFYGPEWGVARHFHPHSTDLDLGMWPHPGARTTRKSG